MSVLALALSLALTSGNEPAEPPPGGDEVTTLQVAPAADGAGPGVSQRGWRQDLATGVHETTFWSRSHHHYSFTSLSLGYHMSFGRRGVFVHATGLVPVQGREDGNVSGLGDYYRLRYGGDLLTGYEWRWRVSRALEAEAGAGLHGSFLVLDARRGYTKFSASPLGLGGEALLRWHTGGAVARWPVSVAVYGSSALDLLDPIHGNNLRRGLTFRAGVLVGLSPRRAP